MNSILKSFLLASVTSAPFILSAGNVVALDAIEELGKNIFFDKISRPEDQQACASCHDAANGWILPNASINATTVVAPGAKPHALGSIKPPSNAYASFSPPFRRATGFPPWEGGNFWDGRAEGYGATGATRPEGDGAVSDTVRLEDLGPNTQYAKYLGPTADQALNPFPNRVEQNIRIRRVCQNVRDASYSDLYTVAFGAPISCSQANYETSYKRLAVALAAWQASSDVNSFSSKRDAALANDPQKAFPLKDFSDQENLGHDLFFGIQSNLNPTGKRARCNTCHNSVPQGEKLGKPGPGAEPHQLYTDNRYHHIGVPFNRQIPDVAKGEKTGLTVHVTNVPPGNFKTPTLRNVEKESGDDFVKPYTHNGWFKTLEGLVHFYNTRDVLPKCETLVISDATEQEALANKCWPAPEFPNPSTVIGNLQLTEAEEAAIVAYIETLVDEFTPTAP